MKKFSVPVLMVLMFGLVACGGSSGYAPANIETEVAAVTSNKASASSI